MRKRSYTPVKPREHVCPICGQKFLDHGSKIYCSEECRDEAERQRRRNAREADPEKAKADSRRWYEASKQKKAEETKNKVTLEGKLKGLRASGKTYAEAQRAETIEKFARVEVPEAFKELTAETPEQPARRRKVFLSKEERDALVRIEAQVETLQAFFKAENSDYLDYPGVVLGRILEQVKGLLEADE